MASPADHSAVLNAASDASRSAEHGKTVMSVLGPLSPDDLGITLTHEHLFLDMRQKYSGDPQGELQDDPELRINMLGQVRRDPHSVRTNLVLDDIETAAYELSLFQTHGGTTVVDLTTKGLGPRPEALAEVASRSGVNIIASCGYYTHDFQERDLAHVDVEELADELRDEIENGLAGGPIRPGVIGEIGTSDPVQPSEWNVLRAAAQVQSETGMALFIHLSPGGVTGPAVASFAMEAGASPDKIVLCHMPGNRDINYHRKVLELGVNLGYDNFGLDAYFDSKGTDSWCADNLRESMLLELLDEGRAPHLMLSHDVCMKFQLRSYGGFGYDHLLRTILPRLRAQGIDDPVIEQLIEKNPQRLLTPDPAPNG